MIDKRIGLQQLVPPDFEGLAGVSHSQAEKKGKHLRRWTNLENQNTTEINPDIIALVKRIYEPVQIAGNS